MIQSKNTPPCPGVNLFAAIIFYLQPIFSYSLCNWIYSFWGYVGLSGGHSFADTYAIGAAVIGTGLSDLLHAPDLGNPLPY